MSGARLKSLLKFNEKTWKSEIGKAYQDWCNNNFRGSSEKSRSWLLVFERQTTEGFVPFRVEPYQREAILRLVYMLEFGQSFAKEDHRSMNQLGVCMATGSGKTAVLMNLISWAKTCEMEHGAEVFIVLAPNTIVRQRLWEGMSDDGNPFAKIGFPTPQLNVLNFADDQPASLDHCDVILSNIHRIFESNRKGSVLRDYLASTGKRFLVVNDEAHNSVTGEYERVMELFAELPGFVARVDLTATPKRPDLIEIPSHFVYDYPPISGIEGIGTHPLAVYHRERQFIASPESHIEAGGRQILKKPVVVRPIPHEVTFEIRGSRKPVNVSGEELCMLLSKDAADQAKAEEIQKKYGLPDSIQKSAIASQRPFKEGLLKKAAELLERCRKEAPTGGSPYKPVLFAVAMNRKEAEEASQILEEMNLRTLLVIGTNKKTDDKGDTADAEDMVSQDASTGLQIPKDALRVLVNKLGRPNETLDVDGRQIACDYDAVVSVYMLKEGWDVNCVEVMVLLRPFDSRLFAEQTVGRGLRIRRDLKDPSYEQQLFVVEPPKWGLDELWAALGAEVEGTDNFRCRRMLSLCLSGREVKDFQNEIEKHRDQLEDNALRVKLQNCGSHRETLVLAILGEDTTKLTPKDVLKFLREEASHGKNKEIEEKLATQIRDDELKPRVVKAVQAGDHLSIIETIERYLSPESDAMIVCREYYRSFLTLKPKEHDPNEDSMSILKQLLDDFDKEFFDQPFEGLLTSIEWSMVAARFNGVETHASGRKIIEKWDGLFHNYVQVADDGRHILNLKEALQSWIHDLASKLEQEIICIRLPDCPSCYSEIRDRLSRIQGIKLALDGECYLSSDEAKKFKNAWDYGTDKLIVSVSEWLERKVCGIEGEQLLPATPEVPTGLSDLFDYELSLFEKEYTQFGYERQFAQHLESGTFFSSHKDLERFNGLRILSWTTSPGIRIPMSSVRNYRPDFLVAVGANNAVVQHLLIEIKREDKRDDPDVLNKAAAARAFSEAHENVSYAILTLQDFRATGQAA